jgi:hypothetical protein
MIFLKTSASADTTCGKLQPISSDVDRLFYAKVLKDVIEFG